MKLDEFLESPFTDLPRKRVSKISLYKQLNQMFREYAKTLAGLNSTDPVSKRAKKEVALIKNLSKQVLSTIKAYLDGFPNKAYNQLVKALEPVQPFLKNLEAPRNDLDKLYRVRPVDTLVDRERREIFHVPFDLRHLVRSERYSISGWPSLYLGASLLVCWEEVGRPTPHTLSVASFKAEGNVSVLDFGYRPSVLIELHKEGFFTEDQMVSYLICWPLLAACAIRAEHPGSSFIAEYVIPQLLLQWLRSGSASVDGLRYFSTRVQQSGNAPRLAINYVFPVKTQTDKGHCSELSRKFKLTLPVPWILLDGIELKAMSGLLQREEYALNSEMRLSYDDTVFKKLEERMLTLKKDFL